MSKISSLPCAGEGLGKSWNGCFGRGWDGVGGKGGGSLRKKRFDADRSKAL